MARGHTTDDAPAMRLPGRSFDPLRTLGRRFAGATGLILLVALIAYVDRSGYTDGAGGTLTPLDALYYSTVSLTTTGYGDIYPSSQSARAITAFVITPLRVIFLVLLVGTTVEILTERTRHAWRVRRWRDTVQEHTIVCGYGSKAVNAIEALCGNGIPRDRVVVIEPDQARAAAALAAGHPVVIGSSTRRASLIEADVHDARTVVVTVGEDDTAVLTILTVKELNPDAIVTATVHEQENAHLLRQSGASMVVPSTGAAGRLAGIATFSPALVSVIDDLLTVGQGIELVEHELGPGEGTSLDERHEQVILVIRDGESLLWNDPRVEPLRPGDRLVEITTASAAAAADGVARVFVTRTLPGPALSRLSAAGHEVTVHGGALPPTRAELLSGVAGADGLLSLLTDRIDAEVLDAAPALRAIANYAVGCDNIDLAAAGARGIPVGGDARRADRRHGRPRDGAAARRRAPAARGAAPPSATGGWQTWEPRGWLGLELRGARLAIVGLGRIGRAVAQRAAAFGMEIEPVGRDDDLHAALGRADVVSLHCPADAARRGT